MGLVYNNEVEGIGQVIESSTPITVIRGLLLTPPNFSFSTKANFATESQYKTAILAGNIFPIQGIIDDEPWNSEDKVLETSTGSPIFQFEGKRGHKVKALLSLEQHKILRTYSHKNWRIFIIDENNNIRGCSTDGTTVKGFKTSYFRVLKMETPSSNSGAVTPIEFRLASVPEWDTFGIMFNPLQLWQASDLGGVLTVQLTVSAVAANSCTISVAYVDDSELSSTGVQQSTPVEGALAANFKILNGTTEVTAGKTVTETAVKGTYTVAATTLVAGYTVQFVPSNDQLYKSDASTLAS